MLRYADRSVRIPLASEGNASSGYTNEEGQPVLSQQTGRWNSYGTLELGVSLGSEWDCGSVDI